MRTGAQSPAFFEFRYQASIDPWHFESSRYELNRYQATLDFLSRPTYRCAFEPGCSIGVLTAALAQRIDHLIACDIANTAVERAKERCRNFLNVQIYQGDASDGPPVGGLDLIVFSELGYYFSADRLTGVARRMADALKPAGEFVAVHWLGHSPDHVLHGDLVHETLLKCLPCRWIGGARHQGFRIDSWRRA